MIAEEAYLCDAGACLPPEHVLMSTGSRVDEHVPASARDNEHVPDADEHVPASIGEFSGEHSGAEGGERGGGGGGGGGRGAGDGEGLDSAFKLLDMSPYISFELPQEIVTSMRRAEKRARLSHLMTGLTGPEDGGGRHDDEKGKVELDWFGRETKVASHEHYIVEVEPGDPSVCKRDNLCRNLSKAKVQDAVSHIMPGNYVWCAPGLSIDSRVGAKP
jgi:hypothetical protein